MTGRVARIVVASLMLLLGAGCAPQERLVRSSWDAMGLSDQWQVDSAGGTVASSPGAAGAASAGTSAGKEAWDLAPHVGMYSLQIGYYDDLFGPLFRQAAEEAVRVLRSQGVEAYFYHGPHRAMVTLGLFSEDDFEKVPAQGGLVRRYGQRIRELRQQYPNTGGNGRVLMQKLEDGTSAPVPSFLVRVR